MHSPSKYYNIENTTLSFRMADKKLSMEAISEKIQQSFGDSLNVIYTDDNADSLVFRIRIVADESDKEQSEEQVDRMEDDAFLRALEANMLSDLTLQGIQEITKVLVICIALCCILRCFRSICISQRQTTRSGL